MIREFLQAFMLIFVAEMGDKTQILAMAFATKYQVKKVLLGIFIGVVLNHGLAVLLGSLISDFLPVNLIQVAAGLAFVIFSLWTLRPEEDDGEDEGGKSKFGPVITVSLAFFIGELGDKTQLTAITLATNAAFPLAILAGTVAGMLFVGSIGIFVGRKIGDRIPEMTVKIIAASVFMLFGLIKLYDNVPDKYMTPANIVIFIALVLLGVIYMSVKLYQHKKQGAESALVRKSRELHEYYNYIKKDIECICLGTEKCGKCEGNKCLVGYTKSIIKYCMDEAGNQPDSTGTPGVKRKIKPFNREHAIGSLIATLDVLKDDPNNEKYSNVHEIRKSLEIIIFGISIESIDDWDEYAKRLLAMDESAAGIILDEVNF